MEAEDAVEMNQQVAYVLLGVFLALCTLSIERILQGGAQELDLCPKDGPKVVLLVIAHPDDESMFFVPSILAAARTHHVKVLCLSNGNYEGKGKIRERELIKACELLGIEEDDVSIIDDEKLQDGPNNAWAADDILRHVKNESSKSKFGGIITFDGYGISGHPNHIAVYKALSDARMKKRLFGSRLHVLQSVPLWLKFIGPLASLLPSSGVQTCYLPDPLLVWKCLQAHRSQAVWYRNLFVSFSRYTFANSLTELKP